MTPRLTDSDTILPWSLVGTLVDISGALYVSSLIDATVHFVFCGTNATSVTMFSPSTNSTADSPLDSFANHG
ncbi:MAG: hypothetical protein OJF47_001132 [Nitrospira sp.]|nr:MAG: hypothetical protein OJF47_001132 [Nitrospira sp.]